MSKNMLMTQEKVKPLFDYSTYTDYPDMEVFSFEDIPQLTPQEKEILNAI